jgi:hypothetical protein
VDGHAVQYVCATAPDSQSAGAIVRGIAQLDVARGVWLKRARSFLTP